MFQSLIGILRNLEFLPIANRYESTRFQSLIGILRNLERLIITTSPSSNFKFKSLLGILRNLESGTFKPIPYIVFKVHLRRPS
jgi:hypothetical protein